MRPYSENLPLPVADEREENTQCPCRNKNRAQATAPAMGDYGAPRAKRTIVNSELLQTAWGLAVLYLLVKIANQR